MPPGKETGDTSADRTDSVLRLVEVRQRESLTMHFEPCQASIEAATFRNTDTHIIWSCG